ncbi:DUF6492 family protein [Microvirga sp. 2MCAF38]|uniref:DUF6492 family protein n=1 Tax=Microvirga sp. 2MCAF38 TaxID=3232989 RepID=UPI003F96C09C
MSHQKLAFLTICFGAEAGMLRLQARSFSKFVDPDCVGSIHLVIDRGSTTEFIRYVSEQVLPEFGHLAHLVSIHAFEETAPTHSSDVGLDGWRRQQALKLVAFHKISEPYTVVLDGKNHFIRSVRFRDFVCEDSRPIMSHDVSRGLEAEFSNSLRYFEVNPASYRPQPFATTPFVFPTHAVTATLDEIERRENLSAYEWFLTRPASERVTELYLLVGYSLSQCSQLEEHFHLDWSIANGWWPSDIRDPSISLEWLLSDLRSLPRFKLSSIHHRAIPELTTGQIGAVGSFWCDMNLIQERSEAEDFLLDKR